MRRKKNGLLSRSPFFTCEEKRLALVDLGDGFEDGAVIQDLFLVDAAGDQGGDAQAVDLARQTAGVLEDTFESIVAERGTRDVPGDTQVMLDVFERFFEIQWRKLVRVGQALAEGFVDGQVQGLAEDGRADQQEGGQRAAVHVGAQEQAELLESGGRQQVGFVEDKQGKRCLVRMRSSKAERMRATILGLLKGGSYPRATRISR